MTLQERADSYARVFAKWPASHLRVVQERGGDVLYGTWCLGNDYRNKTRYYGAYPPGYLERMAAVFPDVCASNEILHVFSGSLPAGKYWRCDAVQPSEYQCSVYDLPDQLLGSHSTWGFRLVYADPPYSTSDAKKYGAPMIDRRRAMSALARVMLPGSALVWLDTCWPMFQRSQWRTVGRIAIIRSTNHRVRLVSIFKRLAPEAEAFVCGQKP